MSPVVMLRDKKLEKSFKPLVKSPKPRIKPLQTPTSQKVYESANQTLSQIAAVHYEAKKIAVGKMESAEESAEAASSKAQELKRQASNKSEEWKDQASSKVQELKDQASTKTEQTPI